MIALAHIKALRPVLIRGHLLREDPLDSCKALGVITSLFPMDTFCWGDWHLDHTVGPQADMNISPIGRAVKRGMVFSSHRDPPVAFPDQMRVLDATVTRRARGSGRIVRPEQRVDVITALKATTIWPAYHHFEEKTKGSPEPGKLADFAILSNVHFHCNPTRRPAMEAESDAVRKTECSEELLLLKRQFEQWRAGRVVGQRIPSELWAGAVAAATQHGAHRVAAELHLDHAALKRRAGWRHDAGQRAGAAIHRDVRTGRPCTAGVRDPYGQRARREDARHARRQRPGRPVGPLRRILGGAA